jgi:hypothetical protein
VHIHDGHGPGHCPMSSVAEAPPLISAGEMQQQRTVAKRWWCVGGGAYHNTGGGGSDLVAAAAARRQVAALSVTYTGPRRSQGEAAQPKEQPQRCGRRGARRPPTRTARRCCGRSRRRGPGRRRGSTPANRSGLPRTERRRSMWSNHKGGSPGGGGHVTVGELGETSVPPPPPLWPEMAIGMGVCW